MLKSIEKITPSRSKFKNTYVLFADPKENQEGITNQTGGMAFSDQRVIGNGDLLALESLTIDPVDVLLGLCTLRQPSAKNIEVVAIYDSCVALSLCRVRLDFGFALPLGSVKHTLFLLDLH